MKYNPDKHHRRSIRLKNYDYSQPGFYFITICTWQRECLFGEIKNAQMHLNRSGVLVGHHRRVTRSTLLKRISHEVRS